MLEIELLDDVGDGVVPTDVSSCSATSWCCLMTVNRELNVGGAVLVVDVHERTAAADFVTLM